MLWSIYLFVARVTQAAMTDSDTYYCVVEKQECKSPPSEAINITISKKPGILDCIAIYKTQVY